jgi:hypothetical protein
MGSIISLLLFVAFFYLMMKYGCGANADWRAPTAKGA